jgi:hypothetical protein
MREAQQTAGSGSKQEGHSSFLRAPCRARTEGLLVVFVFIRIYGSVWRRGEWEDGGKEAERVLQSDARLISYLSIFRARD